MEVGCSILVIFLLVLKLTRKQHVAEGLDVKYTISCLCEKQAGHIWKFSEWPQTINFSLNLLMLLLYFKLCLHVSIFAIA